VRQITEEDRAHKPQAHPTALGDRVLHFHAYLDLLGAPLSGRKLPTLQSNQGPNSACILNKGAGTANCMVASALPTPP
jgi:hypothetical protein